MFYRVLPCLEKVCQTEWTKSTISVPVTGAFILTEDCSVREWQELILKKKEEKKYFH